MARSGHPSVFYSLPIVCAARLNKDHQTLVYMLRVCAVGIKGNWDDYLPLIQFSYNNSSHVIIRMASFEEIYGRR